MTDNLSRISADKRLKVAVVGGGPSGFYAAEALLAAERPIEVDLIERLPTPYGLVRFGVAPDHPKLKSVCSTFAAIAAHERFAFFGNVEVGRDLETGELLKLYDAVLFAHGASSDRSLGIPGENLPGSHSATEFVAWYNGHPDFRDCDFNLGTKHVVVVGQGNVAVDVCRILAKTADELRGTDICKHALEVLAESRVTDIHLVGRRGPAQAKFAAKELREFGELAAADPIVDPADLELAESCLAELASPAGAAAAQNIKFLRKFAAINPSKSRRIHVRFNLGPKAIEGCGRVERMLFERNCLVGEPFAQEGRPTGEIVELETGLVLRSVGYRGVRLPGLPFDSRKHTVPHQDGRILDENGAHLRGAYVSGWIKRGPSGIIGVNRADSIATVESLLADFVDVSSDRQGRSGLKTLLAERRVETVDFSMWSLIDAAECAAGQATSKPREKITSIAEMLAVSRGATSLSSVA
ncbi:FAD-dependent oxidoreductase [Methylorubrum rhodesianum]|uniref:FAD-dependent oxidoreductase n=1 Tax=Methylorubrum rhodesianum TaxID=29427 RepID=UPI003D00EC03